jgi:hypothetical protein
MVFTACVRADLPNETDLISRGTGNYQYDPVWGTLLD